MRRARGSGFWRGVIAPALMALGLLAAGGASSAADPGPASAPSPAAGAPATAKKATRRGPFVLVDINAASRAQLKTLPGIGDAEAARIIAGRPYLSKADLATKKVIPAGVYLSLKDRIIAVQKQTPKRRN